MEAVTLCNRLIILFNKVSGCGLNKMRWLQYRDNMIFCILLTLTLTGTMSTTGHIRFQVLKCIYWNAVTVPICLCMWITIPIILHCSVCYLNWQLYVSVVCGDYPAKVHSMLEIWGKQANELCSSPISDWATLLPKLSYCTHRKQYD